MFRSEPALWLGAINAILAVAIGFGLPLSPSQVGLINAALAALLALITRKHVTPKGKLADAQARA